MFQGQPAQEFGGLGEVETGEVYLKFSGREMVSKVRGLMKLPGENTELALLSGATTPGTSLSIQPYPHLHLEVLPAGNHMGEPRVHRLPWPWDMLGMCP